MSFHHSVNSYRLLTLAHNLAIAAGLCRADRNGYDRCAKLYTHDADGWRPGCQRPAP